LLVRADRSQNPVPDRNPTLVASGPGRTSASLSNPKDDTNDDDDQQAKSGERKEAVRPENGWAHRVLSPSLGERISQDRDRILSVTLDHGHGEQDRRCVSRIVGFGDDDLCEQRGLVCASRVTAGIASGDQRSDKALRKVPRRRLERSNGVVDHGRADQDVALRADAATLRIKRDSNIRIAGGCRTVPRHSNHRMLALRTLVIERRVHERLDDRTWRHCRFQLSTDLGRRLRIEERL
jgi:hypothetical protein